MQSNVGSQGGWGHGNAENAFSCIQSQINPVYFPNLFPVLRRSTLSIFNKNVVSMGYRIYSNARRGFSLKFGA